MVAAPLVLAFAALLRASDDCPEGTVRVATNQPLRPYQCVAKELAEREGPYLPMRPVFRGAGCPKGFTRADGLMSRRCVPDRTAEKVLASESSAPAAAAAEPPQEYVRFSAPGLTVELPRGWPRTDAWADEVPTLYVERGRGGRGRPVALTVSKVAPGQPGYEPLERALANERSFTGARELAARQVGGLKARQTAVDGESRSAYADAGGGVYYLLTYTAPAEAYRAFEPAFERLLSSARFR